MDITIFPVQPVTGRKAGSERNSRGKQVKPDGFAKVLHGLISAHATGDRQDGFGGQTPHQRSTEQQMALMLRRIEQVNDEILTLLL